ncbi:MAG: lysylphosphatidylglycerol synthase domain-containing protein [Aeromicrobium sp.]
MDSPAGGAARRSLRWIRPVGLLLLSLVCAWIIVGLIGTVDWGAVWDAMSRVSLWQVPVLLVVLATRQVLNASPLAFFIEGLGVRRAVQNDQAAILTSTIAPPPADLVLRVAMFGSWDVPAAQGIAGAMMNTITFYVIRFSVPVVGVLLLLGTAVPYYAIYGWSATLGGAVAVTLLGALWAVLRRERAATWIGTTAGSLVARVRSSVDPEAWATSAVAFRAHVVRRSKSGLPASLATLLAMVVVDGLLLSLCLRSVGVPVAQLSTIAVVGVFLTAYPLTLFPLSGLGVLDATVLAAFVDTAGLDLEPDLVAGLVVYRVTTLLVPMVFGLVSIAWWRRTAGSAEMTAE